MLYCERIDVSERVGLNKTNEALNVFIICHYYYFLKVNFRFQPKVCDDCQKFQCCCNYFS